MSLLLDALRRAEQEKLAKQAERPAATERERAAPSAASVAAAGLELQPLGGASAPAANAPAMSGRSDAESAQNLFQAKSRPPAQPGSRKSLILLAVLGAVVIVIAAVGAYVWYSIEALAPKTIVRTRPPAAPGAVPSPPPKPTDFAIGPRLDTPVTPAVTAIVTPFAPRPASVEIEPRRASAASRNDQLVASLLRETNAPAAAPLRLSQTSDPPRVPAEVAAGYDALRSGNLGAARRSYAAALASDPSNVDARLGLATIEARGGDHTAAGNHYRRVLELDPRNATALAGLAALADFSRPEVIEAQLRGDVTRYPQSAALRFTLGNLYSTQARWSEAQLEYFEAHRLDPASADIVFNLAVSLDHLGQPRVAAEYYRRALTAARTQAIHFDPAPVERRLAELGFEPPSAGR